jgi:pteridine reductase
MDLRGRTALVTGAGHRIGRAIALALAGRGMCVAVHYNAAADGANETVGAIEGAGGAAAAFAADLRRGDSGPPLVSDVVSRFGGLDVLVNSAAIMVRTPFGTIDAVQWDDIMAINLRAPFLLAQAAAPHLRAGRGVVVNVADLAAFETWPAYLPHSISKAGVVTMTRALARVLAPEVRVAAVAPGTVLLPDSWRPEDAEHLRQTTPLERNGSPNDVTSTVLFILDSDYLTGETIIVDGGRHIRK